MAMTAVQPRLVVLVLVVAGACGPAVNRADAQQAVPTIRVIADAWAKRQADLKTVKLIWRQEESAASAWQFIRDQGGAPGSLDAEAVFESVGTLFLDGDSVAVLKDIYDPRAKALQTSTARTPLHSKSILKGGECRRHFAGPPGAFPDIAVYGPAKQFQEFQVPDKRALGLALRPLTAQIGGIDLATYHVGRRQTLDGVSCVVLEPKEGDGFTTSYWVDPARDYLIVRAVDKRDGNELRTIDISYEQVAAHRWLPSRWEIVGKGSYNGLNRGHRLKTTVGEPIAAEEFELGELPVGTMILDSRSGPMVRSRVEKKLVD